MNFKTLDYLAEAERIRLAFDVKGECRFISLDRETMALRQKRSPNMELNGHQNVRFCCFYLRDRGRTYGISALDVSTIVSALYVAIRWDGSVQPIKVEEEMNLEYGPILAKGLFHLGLLSPEAEAQLRVKISDHQKLEWTLEYQKQIQTGQELIP